MRFLFAFLLASAAFAQSQPEVTSHEATVTFSSKVNMVSVPVVVRDADGKAIGNLRQDDFQLFDKGRSQVITRFSVEETPPSATVQARATAAGQRTEPAVTITRPSFPERYVAYLFDDVHLNRTNLMQTRDAVNRHLDEALEPNTRAAIFTASGRLVTDFTDSLDKLHKAVNSVQPWESGADPETDCPPVSYYEADYLTNKLLYFQGYLFTDDMIAAQISSGQISDDTLIGLIDRTQACSGVVRSDQSSLINIIRNARIAVRQTLAYGDRDATFSLKAVMEIIRRMSSMPGSKTIVLASPGFLVTFDHRQEEYDALDYALRMNVAINTIDMRGLYTPPGISADSRGFIGQMSGVAMRNAALEASQNDDVLSELADGTGGTFFHNDNGLKEGLNRLAARPEYIYVLGFSPQNLKYDGSYHELKVRLTGGRKLSLQVRKGYWAPRHAEDSAEEAHDEIRDAVFSRDELDAFPVDIETEYFRNNDNKVDLTVSGRLDAGSLRFDKSGDRNNDTVTVVAGVFDDNGNYVTGIQRVIEMHLRDTTLAKLQSAGIVVKETFHITTGRYIVRVVVRDGQGKTVAARNRGVEIP